MKELTINQDEVLRLIVQSLLETGVTPTYRDIQNQLKLSSVSLVQSRLDSMESKGVILRTGRRRNAIAVQGIPTYGELAEIAIAQLPHLEGGPVAEKLRRLAGMLEVAPWAVDSDIPGSRHEEYREKQEA